MKTLSHSIMDMTTLTDQEIVDNEMGAFKKKRMLSKWKFDGQTIKLYPHSINYHLDLDGQPLATAGLTLDYSGRSGGIQYDSTKPAVGGDTLWRDMCVARSMYIQAPEMRDVKFKSNDKQRGGLRIQFPIKFSNVDVDIALLEAFGKQDVDDVKLNGISGHIGILSIDRGDLRKLFEEIFIDIGPENPDKSFASSPDWGMYFPGDVRPGVNLSKIFGIECKVDAINLNWFKEKYHVTFVHKSVWKGPKHLMKESFITEDGYVFVNNSISNVKDLSDPEWYNRYGHNWIHRPKA